jgi:hypothetical protein
VNENINKKRNDMSITDYTTNTVLPAIGSAFNNAASGAAFGLLMGWVIRSGAVHTAKVLAVYCAATAFTLEIVTGSLPKDYQLRGRAIVFAIATVANIFVLRRYNIIAKLGTIFFTANAVAMCVVALFGSNETLKLQKI